MTPSLRGPYVGGKAMLYPSLTHERLARCGMDPALPKKQITITFSICVYHFHADSVRLKKV